jgi:hypothetical protein
MPNLTIKGSFTPGQTPVINQLEIDGTCQTCGGSFDITIPYDLTAARGTVLHVLSKASADKTGKRSISIQAT